MTETELLECGETERRRLESHPVRIGCCMSSGCLSSGSAAVLEALKAAAPSADVFPVGCMGPCSRGPLAWVKQGERTRTYQQLTPELAPSAVQGVIDHRHVVPADDPFFAQQLRIVTSNCGVINPERLEDAVAAGAYQALAQVLREWDPARVCDEITRSGLRGRGGAGYPTGVKWNLVRKAPGGQKYVIANGDEGDPGAYMDRAIMESDPHRVLEGMAIAGYAVGASHGYIYVRGEYPTAVHRLDMAVKQATRRGILGKNVLGTKFEFHVEVRIGAGAFVCGEETALIASIEGGRGMPRPRPPYPAEVGLFGKPTLINNVETLAAIAPICLNGADWFASIGTATSKGTKVFALSGAVVNTGLIEVPMGTTLREIVFHIGGGIPGGKRFKAVQTGGPSGGCIPEQYLDTPVDYESLTRLGSIMGSGGMIVMDETSSMVDVARFFMEFCRDESCGKCVPCRVGTVQMHHLLDKIMADQATVEDLALLEDLCDVVKHTSLCGLGQSAPNPVLSTLRYFRHEYEARIQNRRRITSARRPLELVSVNGSVAAPMLGGSS